MDSTDAAECGLDSTHGPVNSLPVSVSACVNFSPLGGATITKLKNPTHHFHGNSSGTKFPDPAPTPEKTTMKCYSSSFCKC